MHLTKEIVQALYRHIMVLRPITRSNEPVERKTAIQKKFEDEFAAAEMDCRTENMPAIPSS